VKRAKKKTASVPAPRARSTNSRQRQGLIEACISALHLYGPSRTTVEKVVAIAKMSPGIVRFYFDSKAAMLVASLQYLAAEFEERLLVPVARLKDRPVAALELMVDLYLDPDLASPRKVSVWYAFWGEASSRQEYYDICGQKDERFAALVRDLVERLIVETRQTQLDPDAIALGLIGVLEILWQGFAFQTEVTIDRAAARHRCMAYLRSIFPGEFAPGRRRADALAEPIRDDESLPPWSYSDPELIVHERAELFGGSWQLVGHRSQLQGPGDFLAVDIGTERALLIQDADGVIRGFRDNCPHAPHRLSASAEGRLTGPLECRAHGVKFDWDGSRRFPLPGAGLVELELQVVMGLLFVRANGRNAPVVLNSAWFGAGRQRQLRPSSVRGDGGRREIGLGADWKIVVEQCLASAFADLRTGAGMWSEAQTRLAEAPTLDSPRPAPWPVSEWSAVLAPAVASWTAARYRNILAAANEASGADLAAGAARWRRVFLPPNQLIELRPDGLTIWQVLPEPAGRSRVRAFEFSFADDPRAALALRRLARRLSPGLGVESLTQAESIQQGIVAFGYGAASATDASPAQVAFRKSLRRRLPLLRRERAPALRG
jgi:TetR/AcrR family transcriptional repressor of bet genes